MIIATDFNAAVTAGYSWGIAQDVPGANANTGGGAHSLTTRMSFGTGTGQGNAAFYAEDVITPGASWLIDLYNLPAPPSNLNAGFFFATVKAVFVGLNANDDGTTASGVRVGNYALGNRWDGWLSAGGTQDVDAGGVPYVAGSDAGRSVSATARYLLITNLDTNLDATVEVMIAGIGG